MRRENDEGWGMMKVGTFRPRQEWESGQRRVSNTEIKTYKKS